MGNKQSRESFAAGSALSEEIPDKRSSMGKILDGIKGNTSGGKNKRKSSTIGKKLLGKLGLKKSKNKFGNKNERREELRKTPPPTPIPDDDQFVMPSLVGSISLSTNDATTSKRISTSSSTTAKKNKKHMAGTPTKRQSTPIPKHQIDANMKLLNNKKPNNPRRNTVATTANVKKRTSAASATTAAAVANTSTLQQQNSPPTPQVNKATTDTNTTAPKLPPTQQRKKISSPQPTTAAKTATTNKPIPSERKKKEQKNKRRRNTVAGPKSGTVSPPPKHSKRSSTPTIASPPTLGLTAMEPTKDTTVSATKKNSMTPAAPQRDAPAKTASKTTNTSTKQKRRRNTEATHQTGAATRSGAVSPPAKQSKRSSTPIAVTKMKQSARSTTGVSASTTTKRSWTPVAPLDSSSNLPERSISDVKTVEPSDSSLANSKAPKRSSTPAPAPSLTSEEAKVDSTSSPPPVQFGSQSTRNNQVSKRKNRRTSTPVQLSMNAETGDNGSTNTKRSSRRTSTPTLTRPTLTEGQNDASRSTSTETPRPWTPVLSPLLFPNGIYLETNNDTTGTRTQEQQDDNKAHTPHKEQAPINVLGQNKEEGEERLEPSPTPQRRRRSRRASSFLTPNRPRRSSVFEISQTGRIAEIEEEDENLSDSEVDVFGNSKMRQPGASHLLKMSSNGRPMPLVDEAMSESEWDEDPVIQPAKTEEQPTAARASTRRNRRENLFTRMLSRRQQPLISVDDFSDTTIDNAGENPVIVTAETPSRRPTGLLTRMMSKRPAPVTPMFTLPEDELSEKPTISGDIGTGKRKRRRSSGGTTTSRGGGMSILSLLNFPSLASRNSTNYTPMDVSKALKNAPSSKWRMEKVRFSGRFDCKKMGKWEEVAGKRIDKGIKKFNSNPGKYIALTFQNKMRFAHNTKGNVYTFIHREGTGPIVPLDVSPDGNMTLMLHKYQHLKPMPDDALPKENRDPYTWDLTFDGDYLHSPTYPPLLPGRGMGCGDSPNLKIIGDIDPSDIVQGDVGNCWLLSAISALAEFDGAVKRLFRKTKHLDSMPRDTPNQYTITLYDLPTWTEVDIVIDESLCAHPTRKGELLGADITEDGELWVCYLEKAFIVHCGGGWDGIEGGHCTHAWSMMTGCKEQYFIRKNYRTGKYYCSAKYDMYTKEWKKLYNLPRHKDCAGLEPIEWPEVGGGGAMGLEITRDELFLKMYAWDLENYIVGASSKGTTEEEVAEGMVRNHCYSVIDAHHNVAGTDIDLYKVRNPWGHGEVKEGQFSDTGPGWEQYPQIKAQLNPVVADDGIFYMTKEEFFEFFDHIYLSASNMTEFKED